MQCDLVLIAQNPVLAELPAPELAAEVQGLLKKIPANR
jgi:hypothetical protein